MVCVVGLLFCDVNSMKVIFLEIRNKVSGLSHRMCWIAQPYDNVGVFRCGLLFSFTLRVLSYLRGIAQKQDKGIKCIFFLVILAKLRPDSVP